MTEKADRTDTERLDWLQERDWVSIDRYQNASHMDYTGCDGTGIDAADLRAAIDAAMDAALTPNAPVAE